MGIDRIAEIIGGYKRKEIDLCIRLNGEKIYINEIEEDRKS